MGDRISIQFKNKATRETSVVLFSHWGGMDFYYAAKDYVKRLKEQLFDRNDRHVSQPIDRLEPGTVMVDFIRYITKDEERIENDLYLTKSEKDGDNSDNGHKIIEL